MLTSALQSDPWINLQIWPWRPQTNTANSAWETKAVINQCAFPMADSERNRNDLLERLAFPNLVPFTLN
uniref:Uncharacterized protein n=1 Tax=Anguilla anguilla TaxID=7936 RepID=A0A0E9WN32_ANGAN